MVLVTLMSKINLAYIVGNCQRDKGHNTFRNKASLNSFIKLRLRLWFSCQYLNPPYYRRYGDILYKYI
jgi:hypothetical protein